MTTSARVPTGQRTIETTSPAPPHAVTLALGDIPAPAVVAGPDGRVMQVNDHLAQLLGHDAQALTGRGLRDLIHCDSRVQLDLLLCEARREPGRVVATEWAWDDGNPTPTPAHIAGVYTDPAGETPARLHVIVTDLLPSAVHSSDLLLRDSDHRIKNSLQLATSILRAGRELVDDPRARSLLGDALDRLRAIAIVHDVLHPADVGTIDVGTYLTRLVDALGTAYGTAARDILLSCTTTPVTIPAECAVPCGLLVNELVVNALKHAFPDGRTGSITVAVAGAAGDRVHLRVADDGVGMPADCAHPTGLHGLDLVELFRRSLKAELTVTATGGTTFDVWFAR